MKRADVVAGLLLAAAFAACVWDASSFQYGTEFAPGPGFAPVWLSAIGLALSLGIALMAFRATRTRGPSTADDTEPIDKPGTLRVIATLIGLLTMVAIAPWLGLVPSILLFLLFLTLYVQRLSVVTGIAASTATVLFVYIVFVHLLDVPIPSGPLGF
jgi:putative tricarboxylic transport membrane protein